MAGKEQDACPPKSQRADQAIDDDHAGLPETLAAAGLDPPPLAEADQEASVAVDSNSDSDSESTANWVEMPLSCLRFVLARTRATDPVPTLEKYGIYTEEDLERKDADKLIRRMIASMQAAHDDFFEYQAWVREVFLRNGRVMVTEDFLGPRDELQKELDEVWGDGIVDKSVGGGEDGDAEASDRTDCCSAKHQVLLQSKF